MDAGDMATAAPLPEPEQLEKELVWKEYTHADLPKVMKIIDKELSEPYSIFTYRYFLHQWPQLCFLVEHRGQCVGTVVCKMDTHRSGVFRGYLAMLVVELPYRKLKLGSRLVRMAIDVMIQEKVQEVMLEAEEQNVKALRLYENMGFIRDKRLHKYYLSGQDAFRLKLLLPSPHHVTYEHIAPDAVRLEQLAMEAVAEQSTAQ